MYHGLRKSPVEFKDTSLWKSQRTIQEKTLFFQGKSLLRYKKIYWHKDNCLHLYVPACEFGPQMLKVHLET